MSRIEGATLLDMHHAIAIARPATAEPVSPRLVYNARSNVQIREGELWTPDERLSAPHPVVYNSVETEILFQEIMRPANGYAGRDTGLYTVSKLTPSIIAEAESYLKDQDFSRPSDKDETFVTLVEHTRGEETPIPFEIRGHHLSHYAELVGQSRLRDPQNLATALIEESHNSRNAVKQYPEQFPHAEEVAWYFADTLGETYQDLENVQANFIENFMKFKALANDHPVDLLAGKKDEICRGMCKQEHCGLRKFALRPDGTVEHDTNYLSVFLYEAIRLGVAEDIKVTKQSVTFTNAPDEIVEGLRVSAGTVKYVLQNSFDNWNRLSEPGIVRKRSF